MPFTELTHKTRTPLLTLSLTEGSAKRESRLWVTLRNPEEVGLPWWQDGQHTRVMVGLGEDDGQLMILRDDGGPHKLNKRTSANRGSTVSLILPWTKGKKEGPTEPDYQVSTSNRDGNPALLLTLPEWARTQDPRPKNQEPETDFGDSGN